MKRRQPARRVVGGAGEAVDQLQGEEGGPHQRILRRVPSRRRAGCPRAPGRGAPRRARRACRRRRGGGGRRDITTRVSSSRPRAAARRPAPSATRPARRPPWRRRSPRASGSGSIAMTCADGAASASAIARVPVPGADVGDPRRPAAAPPAAAPRGGCGRPPSRVVTASTRVVEAGQAAARPPRGRSVPRRRPARRSRRAAAGGEQRADLGDRLLVVAEVDGRDAGPAGAFAVDLDVVDEEAGLGRRRRSAPGSARRSSIPACGSRRSPSRRPSRRSRRPAASAARAAPTRARCWSASPSGSRSPFSSRISSIIGGFGSSASK